MDWDSVSVLAPRPEDAIYFKKDARSAGKYVNYLCPPLPLLPLCSSRHAGSCKDAGPLGGTSGRRIRALSLSIEGPHLVCVSHCSNLVIYSLAERAREDEVESGLDQETFKEWSNRHSILTSSPISSYQFPCQETVQLLDTQLVRGRPFLCATTSRRLVLFELPTVSCSLQADPVLDQLLPGICCARLSPYIAGQVVAATITGSLFIYQPGVEPVLVKKGGGRSDGGVGGGHAGGGGGGAGDTGEGDGSHGGGGDDDTSGGGGCVAMFGPHPRLVLMLRRGSVYSVDLRRTELPVCSDEACSVLVDRTLFGEVRCAWLGPWQPFALHIATSSHLLVVDIRQPHEPLLSAQHQLSPPPLQLSVTQSCAAQEQDTSLVLLCSLESSVVLTYSSTASSSLVLTCPPHIVCTPSDALTCLKRSELCAVVCSQLRQRLVEQVQGTSLLVLHHCSYAALTLTALGDVFYQCWHYSRRSCSTLPLPWSARHFLGYRLWATEQEQYQRDEALQSKAELLYPGTVKDMTSIATILLLSACGGCQPHCSSTATYTESSPITKNSYLGSISPSLPSNISHPSPRSHVDQTTYRCGDGGPASSSRENNASQTLLVLRQFCEDLPAHTGLDIALLQQWQCSELKARLFEEEDITEKHFDKDQLEEDEVTERLLGGDSTASLVHDATASTVTKRLSSSAIPARPVRRKTGF